MQPALTIAPPDWLKDTSLQAVMDALGAGDALIVGGAVRAAILGETLGDIDIATLHLPNEVINRLAAAGIKTIPTGFDHGTVTAVAGGKSYEITTLRRDVETYGRRAVVAFTTDWAEDAQRRDFTMNTLLMDLQGRIYDPTGHGVDDLKAGRVRFVGKPATRIAEDILRILRFFRFHARYGQGAPDADGLAACIAAAPLMANLSRERITHEIERLLLAPHAGAAIRVMIDGQIMPGFFQLGFDENVYATLQAFVLSHGDTVNKNTLFAYSVWENNVDNLDKKINKYLVLSNVKKLFLNSCIKYVYEHTDSICKNIYLYGQDIALSGGILFNSINKIEADVHVFEILAARARTTSVPVFPVKAQDVMDTIGVGPGVALGMILKKVESWWLANDTTPDSAACLAYAKSLKTDFIM